MAARSGPAVVVDLDPLGPGLDRVLGLEDRDGVRWDDLAVTTGRLGARALRHALPGRGDLRVLTWPAAPGVPPSPAVVRETLTAAQRGHDVVVVDLPRGDADLDEVVARCDLLLVVAVGSVPGVASAARLCTTLPDPRRSRLVLRRARRTPRRSRRTVGLPVLAAMADQRGLDESIDLGLGPVRSRRGPLGRPGEPSQVRLARPGRGMTAAPRPRSSTRSASGWPDAPATSTPHRVAEALREAGRPVGDATVLAVHEALRRDVVGAGPLEPLLRIPGVTDVLVNGPGGGLPRPRRRARAHAVSGSPTRPRCGGSPSGWRAPGAAGSTTPRRTSTCGWPTAPGSTPSWRRSPGPAPSSRCGCRGRGAFTLDELVAAGTLTAEGARLLRAVVAARLAFLVSGGTGTGKTTLLGVAASLVAARRADRRSSRTRASCGPTTPRGGARGAAAQHRGGRRDHGCGTWSGRRCGCGPTGWSSARSAAARWWTCWRRSTPATRAGAAPSTPTPPPTSPPGSRRSRWPPGSGREAAHSQLASAVDAVLHLAPRARRGAACCAEVAVPVRGRRRPGESCEPAVTFTPRTRRPGRPGADSPRLAARP